MTNTIKNNKLSTQEVAKRYMELARQEKWFEIQDELFSDDIKSIEPDHSPYLKNAEGKSSVHEKAENFVSKIEAVHYTHTSELITGSKHFAVGREMDITTTDHGRFKIDQIMLYEVNNGKIVSEQFFY